MRRRAIRRVRPPDTLACGVTSVGGACERMGRDVPAFGRVVHRGSENATSIHRQSDCSPPRAIATRSTTLAVTTPWRWATATGLLRALWDRPALAELIAPPSWPEPTCAGRHRGSWAPAPACACGAVLVRRPAAAGQRGCRQPALEEGVCPAAPGCARHVACASWQSRHPTTRRRDARLGRGTSARAWIPQTPQASPG
jgi:hypothetical protein